MKKFDVFIAIGNEVNYKNTYYYDEVNDKVEVKEEKIVLLEGERMLLNMLNKIKED